MNDGNAYYRAALITDEAVAGEVYTYLKGHLQGQNYDLSIYRLRVPEINKYLVIVVGEPPADVLDTMVVEHLTVEGELTSVPDETLTWLLSKHPHKK